MNASGLISAPLENARQLLAQSQSWRDWVHGGAGGTIDEALSHIHLIAAPDPADPPAFSTAELAANRPLAVIDFGEGAGGEIEGGGWRASRMAVGTYGTGGGVTLAIEADIPAAYAASERDARLDFANRVGAVLGELLAIDEGAGHLVIEEAINLWGPARVHDSVRESEGDYYAIVLHLSWLGGGG